MIVMIMQAGFTLLEAGSVRKKNVQSVIAKNIIDVLISTFAWWLCGYAFAFGNADSGAHKLIGHKYWAGNEIDSIDTNVKWFFQWAFASTASTIVSGSIAERTRF